MPAMYIVANIDFSCVIYTLQQESIQQDHVNSYYFWVSSITVSLARMELKEAWMLEYNVNQGHS